MPLITDNDKFNNEKEECSRAWSKLRNIPEYIRDYERAKDSALSESEQNKLKDNWGFWPLANPNEEMSFEFLCAFSDYDEKVSRFISPINWHGLENSESRNGKLYDPNGYYVQDLKDFNSKIQAEIDLSAPVTVLVQQFKKDIEHFKAMLEIKSSNTKSHDHLEYLTLCLKRSGLSVSDTIDRLIPADLKTKPYDDEHRKAAIQEIRRRINKHEKVET